MTYKHQHRVKEAREEIGRRLEALRIAKNVKQSDLASDSDIAVKTYRRLTKVTGDVGLDSFLTILNELGALEEIVAALPGIQVSHDSRLNSTCKSRQRVRGKKPK